MRVYSHSYCLVIFCTTNSIRVLARERWKTFEISWKKTQYLINILYLSRQGASISWLVCWTFSIFLASNGRHRKSDQSTTDNCVHGYFIDSLRFFHRSQEEGWDPDYLGKHNPLLNSLFYFDTLPWGNLSLGPPALLWIVWTTSKKEGSQLVQTHKRNVKQNWETALLMAENVLFKGTNTRKITATKFLTLTLLIAIHNLHHHTKNVYIRNIFMFMYISYFALSPSLLSFPRTNMHLCISRSGGQMAGWLYVCVYEWPHTANNSHQSSLEAPRLTQIRTALRDDNKRYRVIASLLSTSHFLSIIILSFRFPPF